MADVNISTFDYLQLDFPDEDYTYGQVETNREDNNLNILFKFPDQADNYGLTIEDFNTLSGSSFGYVNVQSAITAIFGTTDTLLPKIDETSSLNLIISVSDSLLPKVDELVAILTRLSRTEDLRPRIDSVVSIFGSVNVIEDLRPKIDEIATLLVSLSVSDTFLPKIDEIASLLVTISTSDTLTPAIEELAELLWLTLEGFRWRDDDGTETTANWLSGQDNTINRSKNIKTRLRTLLDISSDAPGLQLTLQYRPVGDPDWEWRDIN